MARNKYEIPEGKPPSYDYGLEKAKSHLLEVMAAYHRDKVVTLGEEVDDVGGMQGHALWRQMVIQEKLEQVCNHSCPGHVHFDVRIPKNPTANIIERTMRIRLEGRIKTDGDYRFVNLPYCPHSSHRLLKQLDLNDHHKIITQACWARITELSTSLKEILKSRGPMWIPTFQKIENLRTLFDLQMREARKHVRQKHTPR